MKIKVLGCSGAEFPGSNSPSFLLDDEIVFDAGSLTSVLGESAQMKRENIFVTHAHSTTYGASLSRRQHHREELFQEGHGDQYPARVEDHQEAPVQQLRMA